MLDIKKLTFKYDNTPIFNNIEFQVNSGESVGIVGPNGCGKTTLIRVISGVLEPFNGEIYVDGQDLKKLSVVERSRHLSVAPQMPEFPLDYTVYQMLMMARNPYLSLFSWESKQDFYIVQQVISLTEIEYLVERLIRDISGGERQRVLLAMTMIQSTKTVIMDEPTASFDLGYQIGFYRIIKLLKSRGIAVLLAMHDLSLAAQCCDRIIILFKGRIHAEGNPKEVLTEEILSDVYNTPIKVMYHPDSESPVVVSTDRTN